MVCLPLSPWDQRRAPPGTATSSPHQEILTEISLWSVEVSVSNKRMSSLEVKALAGEMNPLPVYTDVTWLVRQPG